MLAPLSAEELTSFLEEEEQLRAPRAAEAGEATRVSPASRPARRMMALGEPENQAGEALAEPGGEKESTSTLVEGVRAVSPKTVAMPALEMDRKGPEAPETASSEPVVSKKESLTQAPQPRKGHPLGATRTIVVGVTLVSCLLVLTLLTWLHLQGPEARAAAGEAVSFGVAEVIEIEEGPFRRGLSDDAQSFIMQLCQRMVDDSGEQCERDRLLAGEFPAQTVRMPAFGIDSMPVGNQEYRQCVEAGACEAIDYQGCQVWTPRGLQIGVRMPKVLQQGERPVVCVNRDRARTYCEWKGGDLPTHNQWEKAARGQEARLFPWGDFWEVDRANWGEEDIMRTSVPGKLDGWAWTSPSGAYPEGQSPDGLYDMAGNVAEWVRGDDELEGHVRGGSWISTPFELRTTARQRRDVDARRTDIGFRCVYPR